MKHLLVLFIGLLIVAIMVPSTVNADIYPYGHIVLNLKGDGISDFHDNIWVIKNKTIQIMPEAYIFNQFKYSLKTYPWVSIYIEDCNNKSVYYKNEWNHGEWFKINSKHFRKGDYNLVVTFSGNNNVPPFYRYFKFHVLSDIKEYYNST